MCLGLVSGYRKENKGDYANLKQRHFPQEELFIKTEVQNHVLKELLNRIEQKYGCLLTNTGCVTNDRWLSVKAITVMVSELDKDWSDTE
jgi:hypothetical protein